MTSGNLGGEPIAYRDDDLDRLAPLCDAMLTHDRPIHLPVRRLGRAGRRRRPAARTPRPWVSRRCRSRGPVRTARCSPSAASSRTRSARVARPRLGEPAHRRHGEPRDARRVRGVGRRSSASLYAVATRRRRRRRPPGYATTRWARGGSTATRVVEVQHHHAHVAAVMAEHGLAPPTGARVRLRRHRLRHRRHHLGRRGAAGRRRRRRAGRPSRQVPLPGGDAAIRNPYRVALAHLAPQGSHWSDDLPPVRQLEPSSGACSSVSSPPGSAASPRRAWAGCSMPSPRCSGLRHRVSYEAQAAIDLEIAAERVRGRDLGCGSRSATAARRRARGHGRSSTACARRRRASSRAFHVAVAELVHDLAVAGCDAGGSTVVLSGGVFQNALLTSMCTAACAVAVSMC
jgi:hydrogenase maturation protein HypF